MTVYPVKKCLGCGSDAPALLKELLYEVPVGKARLDKAGGKHLKALHFGLRELVRSNLPGCL